MSDKVKDAWEHNVALFTLVLHVAGSDVSFIGQLFFLIVFTICLVLIALASFLACILEPHHNDPGWQVEHSGQLLNFIILRIGVSVKEILKHPQLVISESGPGGPLVHGRVSSVVFMCTELGLHSNIFQCSNWRNIKIVGRVFTPLPLFEEGITEPVLYDFLGQARLL